MPGEGNLGREIFILRNGIKMPALGLGTYRVRNPDVIYKVIDEALDAGYRLFDTASVYQNEMALGSAFQKLLPKYNLTRKDIFVTTKLAPSDLAGNLVEGAFQKSLDNLRMDYIDLYLIHFPAAAGLEHEDEKNAELRIEVWKEFEKLYAQGKARAIGVSNFTLRHLTQLAEVTEIQPMVNQVEWHPYYHQHDLLEYCNKNGVRLQAYCPFGGLSHRDPIVMLEEIVRDLFRKYKVTACQILLAWCLQRGVAAIPKSTNPKHIRCNNRIILRLSPEELAQIDSLGSHDRKFAWNPEKVA